MRIKLIPNPEKPWAVELADELKYYLEKHEHSVTNSGADATICIGGDGTILHSNHVGLLEGSVIGIGSNSSYICQLTRSTWKDRLAELLKGNNTNIMSLSAKINDKRFSAINDFVIHCADYRVVQIEVEIGDEKHLFLGDGIILSSAIGTAGYAYSAGADKLEPKERKISVVPICPYRRAFSPVILNEDAEITIRVNRECAFIVDGISAGSLKHGSMLSVQKGKDLMFYEGVGFYKQG